MNLDIYGLTMIYWTIFQSCLWIISLKLFNPTYWLSLSIRYPMNPYLLGIPRLIWTYFMVPLMPILKILWYLMGVNSLFSTAQDNYFGMNVKVVAKNNSGNKYLHYWDQIILMTSSKDPIYVTFQEPTNKYFGSLSCGIIILGWSQGSFIKIIHLKPRWSSIMMMRLVTTTV